MRRAMGWILLAACSAPPDPAPPVHPTTRAVVADPCGLGGRWDELPSPALEGRVDHTAVWTGTEMIVWGGTQGVRRPFSDGARFDPVATTWQPTSMATAPAQRDDHVAVWTGREMIVWRSEERRVG